MPLFRYQAVDQRGRSLLGVMPAVDGPNLERKLKLAGLWLIDFTLVAPSRGKADEASRGTPSRFAFWGRRRRRELIDFCTLMTYQLRAGVTLVRALDVACQDCRQAVFHDVLTRIRSNIESGFQFHEAVAKYPHVFSPQFVSVIRAGEISGKLPDALDDLRGYLEWVDQMIADVRQATLYPVIIACAVAAFVLFLFTFIVPKFAALLESLHVQLPLITQLVFTTSHIIRALWWMWVPLLLLVLVVIPIARRVSKPFAVLVDGLKLRLPLFGDLNRMLALSRFAHNLALLYRSGILILSALDLTEGLVGNAVVAQAVAAVREDIKVGRTISEAMHRQPVFSALLLRMVNVGEQSGNFDQALENVADYYNQVVPRRIKALFTVLEPTLMLILIIIVGCVAVAIYLPILTLMSGLSR